MVLNKFPMDGVSMLYATQDKMLPTGIPVQYFEMFGNRAIYNNGWLARVVHSIPWQGKPLRELEDDKWELYNTEEDFSLVNDLAAENPEKVEELKKSLRKRSNCQ